MTADDSSVIRDMMSVPASSSETPEALVLDIDIDYESVTVLITYLENPHIDAQLKSYSQAKGLLKACDFLALETLGKSVLLNLENMTIPTPDIWDVFCLAGRYDAPKIARQALNAIHRSNHPLCSKPTSAITKQMAEACDTKYLLGYYHAVYEAIQGAYNRGRRDCPWERVAQLFEPAEA